MIGRIEFGYDGVTDVKVVGDYAYLATTGTGLRIIDISDPTYLEQTGVCTTLGDEREAARAVVISGNYAYLASYYHGLQIMNIEDPTSPEYISDIGGSAYDLAISGDYAYIANYGGALSIIDISNPDRPRSTRGQIYFGGYACDVAVTDTLAYVASYAGLSIIDVTNPDSLEVIGHFRRDRLPADGIAIVGDYAYLLDYYPSAGGAGHRC